MKNNGWIFNDIFNKDASVYNANAAEYCKDVPSTSYCGYAWPGDLMISYVFSYSGIATLHYGQSWIYGSIRVKKNNVEIDSRSTQGSSTTEFVFSSGDVLQIVEHDQTVINIHSLTLRKSGEIQRIININR